MTSRRARALARTSRCSVAIAAAVVLLGAPLSAHAQVGPGVVPNATDGALDTSDPLYNPVTDPTSVPGAAVEQEEGESRFVASLGTMPVTASVARQALGWPAWARLDARALHDPGFVSAVREAMQPGTIRATSFDTLSGANVQLIRCANTILGVGGVRRQRVNAKGVSACSAAVNFVDDFYYYDGVFTQIDYDGPHSSTNTTTSYVDMSASKRGTRGNRTVKWCVKHVSSSGASIGCPQTPYRGPGKSL